MQRWLIAGAAIASALAWVPMAGAASGADIAQLRDEIRQLKEHYETRVQALEARVKEVEAAANRAAHVPQAMSSAAAPVEASSPPAGGEQLPAQPEATSNVAASGETPANRANAFNPAISAVLTGVYANLSQDPRRYALSGFALGDDVSPGRRGFGVGESELTLAANVDHLFSGTLTVALTPENTVSVEEAYGLVTGVGNGLAPKFGRFLSAIGYQNEQHQHAWDFYDAPLAYQAFLGGQYSTDGLQLKWLAPSDEFVELGAEIGNGANFPGSDRNRNGIGAASLFAHVGGDLGASHSWRAGVSYLDTRADGRETTQFDSAGNLVRNGFTGRSRIAAADFVWKYAPNGNAQQTNFKVQAEYFWRRERGELTYDIDGAFGPPQTDTYGSSQSGGYVQGVWQFMPQWRAGLRYDRLNPGAPDYGANAAFLATQDFHPQRYAFMVDWTPSEFSRLRLQYARNGIRPDVVDSEWFLQYILTLGAHGAHRF